MLTRMDLALNGLEDRLFFACHDFGNVQRMILHAAVEVEHIGKGQTEER